MQRDKPHLINQYEFDAEKDKHKDTTKFNTDLWSSCESVEKLTDHYFDKYKLEHPIRYEKDVIKYKNTLKVILLNLARTHLASNHYCTTPLSNNYFSIPQPYLPTKITRTLFKNLVTWLAVKNYTHLYKAPQGTTTKIHSVSEPLDELKKAIDNYEVGYKHIYHHKSTQLVILKDEDKKLITYTDTVETKYRREILRRYNSLIEHSLITIDGKELFTDSFSKTIYNSKIGLGGRIYGGEWQNCNKEARKTININSEPAVEIDIRACSIHMALHLNGITPPPEVDMYGIYGYDRKLIKLIVNTLINTTSETTKLTKVVNTVFNYIVDNLSPPETHSNDQTTTKRSIITTVRKNKNDKILLSDYGILHTFNEVKEAVEVAYDYYRTTIPGWLFKGRGLELQHYESMVCIKVIEEFLRLEKVVLTIHDSYLVANNDKELLKETLNNCYEQVIGIGCKPSLREV